jgi:hypothetical protein
VRLDAGPFRGAVTRASVRACISDHRFGARPAPRRLWLLGHAAVPATAEPTRSDRKRVRKSSHASKSIDEQNNLQSPSTLRGRRSLAAFTKGSEESAAAVKEARAELNRAQATGAVRSLAGVIQAYDRFTAVLRHAKPPTTAGGIQLHRIYSTLKAEALARCNSLGAASTL